jgi:uncharacterized flavoprotein (TIGR03862 family)
LKKKLAIVGGGASALILSCELDPAKFEVSVFEKNNAAARKFLVAGDGGLNITHSEEPDKFIERYSPNEFLKNAFSHFSNKDLIQWLNEKGIETFTGSSARVFPVQGLKPVEVLNTILSFAKTQGVNFFFQHEWTGFTEDGSLNFSSSGQTISKKFDEVIFCLGGASWPVTGSKGDWTKYFHEKKIDVIPFNSSNCSFRVKWPELLIEKIEGKILKNITAECGDHLHAGEIVLTKFGLEGSGIYPLSPQLRKEISEKNIAKIYLDLKPSFSIQKIVDKLTEISGESNYTEKVKRALNLPAFQIQLLKFYLSKEDFLSPEKLASHIKHFEIKIVEPGPIENAISTVGGISLSEINENFELKKLPRHYAIGEMLDYDAPTGGYLLQSCFSMGKFLADHMNTKK